MIRLPVICLLLLALSASALADTLHVAFDTTLYATADGSITRVAPTFNYGIRDSMGVGKSTDTTMTFLYFPMAYMADSVVVIETAICSVRTCSLGGVYYTYASLYKSSSDWFEGGQRGAVDSAGACWNWRGFGTGSVTGATITSANKNWTLPMRASVPYDTNKIETRNTWYAWDGIVALIQSLVDAPLANYGLVLAETNPTATYYAYFRSRENATYIGAPYKPRLKITGYYVVNVPETTAGQTWGEWRNPWRGTWRGGWR